MLAWRRDTRAGADDVSAIDRILTTVGFGTIHLERHTLDLASLDRADGIMGLAGWGQLAANAGRLSNDEAREWTREAHQANEAGSLRYKCVYVLATGHVAAGRRAITAQIRAQLCSAGA